MTKEPEVKPRQQAMIGDVLVIRVEPGTKIFCAATEKLLGIVGNRLPVINVKDKAVYLSEDDWDAAQAALPPKPPEVKH